MTSQSIHLIIELLLSPIFLCRFLITSLGRALETFYNVPNDLHTSMSIHVHISVSMFLHLIHIFYWWLKVPESTRGTSLYLSSNRLSLLEFHISRMVLYNKLFDPKRLFSLTAIAIHCSHPAVFIIRNRHCFQVHLLSYFYIFYMNGQQHHNTTMLCMWRGSEIQSHHINGQE